MAVAYEVDDEAIQLMQRAVSRSPGIGYTIKYRQWKYHSLGSCPSYGLGTPPHRA